MVSGYKGAPTGPDEKGPIDMSTARNAAKRRKLAHKRAIGRVGELEAKAKEQQALLGELTMRLGSSGGTSETERALRSEVAATRAVVQNRDIRVAELSSKISDLEIQVETLRALKDDEVKKAETADSDHAAEGSLIKFLRSSLEGFDSDHDADLETLKSSLQDFHVEDGGVEIALAAIACAETGMRNELAAERARADEAEAALAEAAAIASEPDTEENRSEEDGSALEALEQRARDAETTSKALAAECDKAVAEVERLKAELEKAADTTDDVATEDSSTDDEAESAEMERLKEEVDDLTERLRAAEEARDTAVSEVEHLKEELAAAEADSSLDSAQEQLQQALDDARREMQNETERAGNLQTMLEGERRKYQQLYQKSFPLPSQEGVQFGAEVVGDGGKKGFFGKKKPFVIEAFCYHKDGRISVMNSDGDQLPINQEKWNDN